MTGHFACRFTLKGYVDIDGTTGGPSLAHMAILYGAQTEQELNATLDAFYTRCGEFRTRYENKSVSLSFDEALEAFALVAPLFEKSGSDFDEIRAVINAICFPCFVTGGFGFRMRAVEAILEGFEREIAEGVEVLHLQHDGEEGVRLCSSWDRFVAYRALVYFVGIMSRYESAGNSLDGEEQLFLERAQEIWCARSVNRPRGRYDPRRSIVQNTAVYTCLQALANCGLPVTSLEGDSLAGAMADTTGIPVHTICDAWRDVELRTDQRRRQRRCAGCGKLAGEGARRIGPDHSSDLLCRACQTRK